MTHAEFQAMIDKYTIPNETRTVTCNIANKVDENGKQISFEEKRPYSQVPLDVIIAAFVEHNTTKKFLGIFPLVRKSSWRWKYINDQLRKMLSPVTFEYVH